MMRTAFTPSLAALAIAYFNTAVAASTLTTQIRPVPQAQFAGSCSAATAGYCEADSLTMPIKLSGPHASPVQGGGSLEVRRRQLEDVAKPITTDSTSTVGYLEPLTNIRTERLLLPVLNAVTIEKCAASAAFRHAMLDTAFQS